MKIEKALKAWRSFFWAAHNTSCIASLYSHVKNIVNTKTNNLNLEYITELSRYYQKGLIDVSQDNLVATFPQWSRHYEIEFDIKVEDKSSMTDEYINIFHMSTIDTASGAGSNIPS